MRIIFLVFASAFLLGACNHTHQEVIADHHSLNFTIFTPTAELYVEFPALVEGDSIKFGAHLTNLINYKPFNSGILQVSLVGNGQPQSAQASVSAVAGIFRPLIIPNRTGMYNLYFEWKDDEQVESFIIENIQVFVSEKEAESVLSEEAEVPAGAITYTKEQAWKTNFGTKLIESAPFGEVIYTSGQILPANGDETTVVAPFSGVISFANESIVSGSEVKKGEILMKLSGSGMDAENVTVRYETIKAEYEKAKANYNRASNLVVDKIISEPEFIDAKTKFEIAQFAYSNISDNFDGNSLGIASTMTGYIKNILVTSGQFIESGTPLAVISQNKRLVVRADVSQSHWDCLPNIVEANFITPYDGEIYNTQQLGGRLISYSRSASNSSYSAPVFFEINNSGMLISGTFIEVYLLAKPTNNVIAIPISALVEEQGNFFVFVQLSGESFEKREVETGVSDGSNIAIISGLKSGERIVSEGSYQLKLASMSSALPSHGHDH